MVFAIREYFYSLGKKGIVKISDVNTKSINENVQLT